MEAAQHRLVSRWLSNEARAVCEAGAFSDGCGCTGAELSKALLEAFAGLPSRQSAAVLARAFTAAGVDLALDDPGTDIVTRQTLVTGWERVALCWEGKGFGPPWRPEFVSAASIEWMLRDQGTLRDPAVRVLSVDVHRIGVGVGLLSFMMRVKITYNDKGNAHRPPLPTRVLAKLTPSDSSNEMRARVRMSRYIVTEHDFYATMTPSVAEGVGGVCACYYRAYDEPTDRSVLLLEDLKARPGEYERDQIEGCTNAEAKVVVTALAKLHAYFYNRGRAMATFARSLVGSALTPRVTTKNGRKEEEGGGDSFDRTLDQLRSALPDLRRAAAVLGHGPGSPSMRAVELLMSGENMRDLYAAMAPRDEGGESDGTLMWGDARADNVIFFRGDGGELSCVLIDWQLARSGPGECDLALFISTSLPRERRRELAVPLLRVYHTELVAALTARGSIKELPTFEAVLCNFQRGLLFNARVLPLAANGFNGAASESKRGEALLRSIVVGHLDALEAWDAHGWLTSLSQRRRAAKGSVDRTTAPNEDARLLPAWVRAAAAASSETSKL